MSVSKGVDTYIYLSGGRFSATVRGRDSKDSVFRETASAEIGAMQHDHREIVSKSLKVFEKSGRYAMEAAVDGKTVFHRYAEINPITGNMADSDLDDMMKTKSVIEKNYAISYGFADHGRGDRHQAWLRVTENYSEWMGACIDDMKMNDKPLGTFVLPGSHDAGMFTGLGSNADAGTLLRAYAVEKAHWAVNAAAWATNLRKSAEIAYFIAKHARLVRALLIGVTYTQKDDIATQLALGSRYFDFRPGYDIPGYRKDDTLRAQHNFVPGCTFASFLTDVVKFLKKHKREFVVVHVKFDGFAHPQSMKPTPKVVDTHLDDALAGSGIARGGVKDLDRTIGKLLEENRRLIVLRDNDPVADSYNDGDYATDNPKDILKAVKWTIDSDRRDKKWMVLQLQATYSNKWSGRLNALTALSDAASPLLSTKAKIDHATYPWLMSAKADFKNKAGSKLVVLLNDFVDNALTSHAWALTRRRCRPAAPRINLPPAPSTRSTSNRRPRRRP